MASPKTLAFNRGVAARAAVVRKEVAERYAVSHPSLPKRSYRGVRTTKGRPFSRMMLKDMVPGYPGSPAILFLVHPTRNTMHEKRATPELIATFFSAIPPHLADAMLGR